MRIKINKFTKLLIGSSCIVFSVSALATSFIANSFYDQKHPFSRFGYIEWSETVKKLSNGELTPEIYTGTVLLAPRSTLQGIRDNIVQVGSHAAVYTPSELPVANAIQELGFNYSDQLVAGLAVADFSMNNELQLNEWKEKGVVYLGSYVTSPYVLFCREPVRNLSEIKGKRIRTAGSTVSAWVEEAGGVPVNVPSSEMYTGLDRGSLDCASNSPLDLIERSLWEVAEHTTLLPTGMYWSGPHWGYNPEFWTSLTNGERGMLKQATAKAMVRTSVQYKVLDDNALEQAKINGNNIYQPDEDLLASVNSFREQALNNISNTAKEKYGISDPDKLIGDFQVFYEKWNNLITDNIREDESALTKIVMDEIYNKLSENYGLE